MNLGWRSESWRHEGSGWTLWKRFHLHWLLTGSRPHSRWPPLTTVSDSVRFTEAELQFVESFPTSLILLAWRAAHRWVQILIQTEMRARVKRSELNVDSDRLRGGRVRRGRMKRSRTVLIWSGIICSPPEAQSRKVFISVKQEPKLCRTSKRSSRGQISAAEGLIYSAAERTSLNMFIPDSGLMNSSKTVYYELQHQ